MQLGKLPNLNALKVLVVVANEGSFSKAAEMLGLTQSAISKKIAALEAQLGQTLFTRHHKRIEITAFGRRLADISADAFDRILAELDRPTARPAEQIRLYSDADFAELWLFPRLHRFETSFPDIRVSIFVEVGMNSPPAEDHDCAIIWGRGGWSGCNFRPLISNSVFPVASPDYFSGLDRAPTLSDIPERHLIHDQTRFWWRAFREAVGDRSINFEAGRMYNRTALCLVQQRGGMASPSATRSAAAATSRAVGWCALSHSSCPHRTPISWPFPRARNRLRWQALRTGSFRKRASIGCSSTGSGDRLSVDWAVCYSKRR